MCFVASGSCPRVGVARSPAGPLPTHIGRHVGTRPADGSRTTRSPVPPAGRLRSRGHAQRKTKAAPERRSQGIPRVSTPYADITQIRFWGLRLSALSAPPSSGAPPSYEIVLLECSYVSVS